MLFCYQCEDWILNDTQFGMGRRAALCNTAVMVVPAGEIGLLREQLNRLQNQRFECSQTRSVQKEDERHGAGSLTDVIAPGIRYSRPAETI